MATDVGGAIPSAFGRLARLRRKAKLAAVERWIRRGTDATDLLTSRPAMVVAPHPDDESLGCGLAVLGKRAQGLDVRIVFVSDGGASHPETVISRDELVARRRAEARAAAAVLDVSDGGITFLDFPDGAVTDHVEALTARLTDLILEAGLPELLVPSVLDHHPDHIACNRASLAAAARCPSPPIVYEYTIWFWYRFPRLDPGWSNFSPASWLRSARLLRRLHPLVVSLPSRRAQKADAIRKYETQFVPYGTGEHDRALPDDLFARVDNGREVFFALDA
jgi:LmbE family N-acetylglucosaminyl deacetylase